VNPADLFLLLVRWLHILAAVAWVGGGLFYLIVLGPALRQGGQGAHMANRLVALRFRAVVDACVVTLVMTGVILALDRLTDPAAGVPYVATLAVKAVLALWMFALAWRWRRPLPRTQATEQTAPQPQGLKSLFSGGALIAMLGVVVLFLSDLLRALFERGLAA
jgi:uncharacterized membrane protein